MAVFYEPINSFFKSRNWQAFDFQTQCWQAFLDGYSGLVHAQTGNGKTYAVWLAPVLKYLKEKPHYKKLKSTEPIRVLWITPLRALANDVEKALKEPIEFFSLPWSVQSRTGDTKQSIRRKQKEQLPTCLITTPESLSLMLADPKFRDKFKSLESIIIDEWHELLSSKRGVQTELCLARLKRFFPDLRIWGMSATIGNLEEACDVLCGPTHPHRKIIKGVSDKKIEIETLYPDEMETYPWSGHLGLHLIDKVIEKIHPARSVLLFTNTRSQTEMWYQAILEKRPDWAGQIALHHGSLDREIREFVEQGLKVGILRLVVATSSLDLGVDFSPVDLVIQVGSPKGVARIIQRAGRSGHSPGLPSKIVAVPTNSLEIIEFAAVKDAIRDRKIESRPPLDSPLDLLAQHLTTISIGGGFRKEEMFEEIKLTFAYQNLSLEEFNEVLEFISNTGPMLQAYPEFVKVIIEDGVYKIADRTKARMHVMSIGTISADPMLSVKFVTGKRLGAVEESFASRLKKGDVFVFSGRTLEFIRIRELEVQVKAAEGKKPLVPRWGGGRMPLSTQLSANMRLKLEEAQNNVYASTEMQEIMPVLEFQRQTSHIPSKDELLIEKFQSKEGFHLFIYPFEGRLVHEGLMALFAYRIGQVERRTFSIACNDYGLELLSDEYFDIENALELGLFDSENLEIDIMSSMNASEMARRQFREVARVAGLVFQGYPGQKISNKNLQANSGLFYDVFKTYDPNHILLNQARKEVLQRQLEISRLRDCLKRMTESKLIIVNLERPSPLGFPILADRLREKLSTEQLSDRLLRLIG